ncbi:hypothetical protein LPB140_02020 [Sphingorhabdus lutea]|uniref:Uncharacterized protein n=2 Tax=Sphingorhabdus lutea TaxID=1913578 RepID=A0A1L3JEC1_9SPHN|nr:hypothetical protein LPB140_02020 [Sphingorhabdus lutea]
MGYGAGLPIAWQGWVFLLLHIMLIIGVVIAIKNPIVQVILVFVVALAPLPIYKARTDGGWKWRS